MKDSIYVNLARLNQTWPIIYGGFVSTCDSTAWPIRPRMGDNVKWDIDESNNLYNRTDPTASCGRPLPVRLQAT